MQLNVATVEDERVDFPHVTSRRQLPLHARRALEVIARHQAHTQTEQTWTLTAELGGHAMWPLTSRRVTLLMNHEGEAALAI